jgi:arylsulfatase A-like enzyme
VHGPIQTTEALWSKYQAKAVKQGLAEKRFIFDRRLPVRQVQDCPIYGGMVESMDAAVGIVLAKLKELDLEDNTIICFTSDNGGVASGDSSPTSNLPLRGGKGRQWEGGIREPFYISAPGMTSAGSLSASPVSGIDWYPTLLELAGVPMPEGQDVDGVSLVPLLGGESMAERSLFWHYPHYGNQGGEPSSIVTMGDWKLIHYHEDGRDELYHLGQDVGEQNDLAAKQPERAFAMRMTLDTWLKSSGAKMPVPDTQFDSAARSSRWERLLGPGMQRLEKLHKGYLDKGWSPNKKWWGSSINIVQ